MFPSTSPSLSKVMVSISPHLVQGIQNHKSDLVGLFISQNILDRTVEQFSRINIFQNNNSPKYAITSNGGNIIIDGIVDADWNNHIREKINNNCTPFSDVLKKYFEIKKDNWISEFKTADELFHYAIIERANYPQEILSEFELWLEEYGWNLSIQGRKFYLIPRWLDKWNAVQHIAEIENADFIYAAGDSKLDFKLLLNSHKSIMPIHGIELLEESKKTSQHFNITNTSGLFASEEILNFVNSF